MEGSEITTTEAVLDNGRFGTRTIRFETGRLALQGAHVRRRTYPRFVLPSRGTSK